MAKDAPANKAVRAGAPGVAATGTGAAGTKPDRDVSRFGGPRTLASLLPAITRPAFRRRAPESVAIMSDWVALAGPAVAAMATPRRFHGGTLTLAANGPAAMELQHGVGSLMARLNAGLGRPMVERIRFVQAQPDEVAGRVARGVAPPPEPVAVAGMEDGELRDALERLGGRVAARARER